MLNRIKTGIILNDYNIQEWQYSIIEAIRNSEYGEICLIVMCKESPMPASHNRSTTGRCFTKLHVNIDRTLFFVYSDYNEVRNITELTGDIPFYAADIYFESDGWNINNKVISELELLKPDVLLNFTSFNISGEVVNVPKYGVWVFPFLNEYLSGNVYAGYLETVTSKPTSEIVLELLHRNGQNEILAQSLESTCTFSINANRQRIFWKASLFAPRIIKGIYKYGDSYFDMVRARFNKIDKNIPVSRNSQLSLYDAIVNFLVSSKNSFLQIIKKIYFLDDFNWFLYIKIEEDKDHLHNNFNTFNKLTPPGDRFWADPFVISKDGFYYVFVEEFIYSRNKGHISVLELGKNGEYIASRKILEKPYHLSYPFIFDIDGHYYMIPESAQDRTIGLYKCKKFPDKWEFVKNIMVDVAAVDTTLLYYSDKWWLFTAIDETEKGIGSSTDLFLYFTDDILSGKWESHPLNPVVSDAGKARPAGKIFMQNQILYRPSQDCSVRYGKSLKINQINVLSTTEYEEITISTTEADWESNLRGTHTFNFYNNITLIDAYSYRSRISNYYENVKCKINDK